MAKFFTDEEFACPCCGESEMDPKFVQMLDALRYMVKHPIYLNSAYRCDAHNEDVGGVPDSPHVMGKAVDIRCGSMEAYGILKHAFELGFTGVGIAQKDDMRFIHLDSKEEKPRPNVWTY